MIRRFAIAVAAALCAVRGFGWSARLTPPLAGLPVVAIEIGYASGYVPDKNAPIRIWTEPTSAMFDGYIGFRLEVQRKRTGDPVWAFKASIPAGRSWSITTRLEEPRWSWELREKRPPREIIIEWRNRAGVLIAAASAGVPPWSPRRPLRVLGGDERPADGIAFGKPIVPINAQDLQPHADWYSGFDAIVVPTSTWFALPMSVRSAMYTSGIEIVLFGFPRRPPTTTPIDAAVLPIDFDSAQRVHPKNDAAFATKDASASLVMMPGAAWAADEQMIREPLPSFEVSTIAPGAMSYKTKWSFLAAKRAVNVFAREIAAVIAAGLAILLWRSLRKNALLVVVITATLLACVHPLYRNIIRRPSGTYTRESWVPIRPGAVMHRWYEAAYGKTPLRIVENRQGGVEDGFELPRMSEGPDEVIVPDDRSVVVSYANREWAYTRRASHRIEMSDHVQVRVRSVDASRLTIDYVLPAAAQTVEATWKAAGRQHGGAVDLPRRASGSATITSGEFTPDWMLRRGDMITMDFRHLEAREVGLQFDAGDNMNLQTFEWAGTVGYEQKFTPYEMLGSLRKDGQGHVTSSFVVPDADLPLNTKVFIHIGGDVDLNFANKGLHLQCDAGSAILGGDPVANYEISSDQFRRLCRSHGLLKATLIKSPPNIGPDAWITVSVGGKRG